MIPLTELWLPILLSAVFVFVVSSIIHMVVQFHNKDYKKLPDEAKALEALGAQKVQPGAYRFPFASMKEMSSPEVIEKYNQGPVGLLTVVPNSTVTQSETVDIFRYSMVMK